MKEELVECVEDDPTVCRRDQISSTYPRDHSGCRVQHGWVANLLARKALANGKCSG